MQPIISENVYNSAKELVKNDVKNMISFFKEHTNYPITKKLNCSIKFNDKHDSNSYGGYSRIVGSIYHGGCISMSLKKFLIPNSQNKYSFVEYARISNNNTIGSILNQPDWKVCVKAITAHEFAHVMQYYIYHEVFNKLDHSKQIYLKPHGKGWQNIYKMLRVEFVNNYINREV